MPDEIDRVQSNRDLENEAHIRIASRAAAKILAGEPGECKECGELSGRLVLGRCAPCRDSE